MTRRKRNVLMGIVLLSAGTVVAAIGWTKWQVERTFQKVWREVEEGDYAEVGDAIKVLQGKPEFESQVLLLRAATLMSSKQYEAALRQLVRVEAEGPLLQAKLLLAGRCFYQRGQFSEAASALQTVVDERPDLVGAHRLLVTIYHRLGAANSALAESKQVARLDPDDFHSYRVMGLIYKEDYLDCPQAIDNYRKALARHPPEGEAEIIRRELVECLIDERAYREALDLLAAMDEDAGTWASRAECAWNLGDEEEARRLLKSALASDPDHRRALSLAATVHLEAKELDSAADVLQRIIQQDPHDYRYRYQLAHVYQKLGRWEQAESEIQQADESKKLRSELKKLVDQAGREPHNAEIRQRIADMCETLDQVELADIWRQAATNIHRFAEMFDEDRE